MKPLKCDNLKQLLIKEKIIYYIHIIKKLKYFFCRYVYRCFLTFNMYLNPPKRINNKMIILSVASWKPRLPYLSETLDSLLNQIFKADLIILWLDKEDQNYIPKYLSDYVKKGIDIRFVKNIGSYKKLIPALKKFPDDIIITVDDDISYPRYLIGKLYKSYIKHPHLIHANRCRKMIKKNSYTYEAYEKGKIITDKAEIIEASLLSTGVGGILYPGRKYFYKDIINEKLFLQMAPEQDDIWFWYMLILKGNNICKIKNHFEVHFDDIVKGTVKSSLHTKNNYTPDNNHSPNDIALKNLLKYYNKKKLKELS